jgi:hypothetical protein
MSKIIRIVIDAANGTSELETKGFTGGACKVAAKPYREALGGEVLEEHDTAEMRQTSAAVQQHQLPG